MIPINSLEKTGNLYHATPVWKVEYLLEDGLRVDCARKAINGNPYQCISDSIRICVGMAQITNEKAFKATGLRVLGVIGFDVTKLPEAVRAQIQKDPLLNGGLRTFADFPAECIDQVIVTNLKGDQPDNVIKKACENLGYSTFSQIRFYDSIGKFVPIG